MLSDRAPLEFALSFSFGVALFHFMGALAAVLFSKSCETKHFGMAMALSAGIMSYVGGGQLFHEGIRYILKEYKQISQGFAIALSLTVALALVGGIVRWILDAVVHKLYADMGVHALHGYLLPDSPPLSKTPRQVEEHPKTLIDSNAAYSMGSILLPMMLHNFPIGLITFTSLVQNTTFGIPLGFALAFRNIFAAISTATEVQSTSGSKLKAFAWVCTVSIGFQLPLFVFIT
jgi:ZIP family zinc transporter